MPASNLISLDLDEGVDRKEIKRLCHRFQQVNDARLARARASLSSHQQLVMDLLPLLFALNHPLLPGFVSTDTPAGISGYTPNKKTIDLAHQLARSIHISRTQKPKHADIHSLILMGSCGSIGHSQGSDLDIWLCHDPKLSPSALVSLEQKADGITSWAHSQQLEVHFFLINADRFRLHLDTEMLAAEHCGSTQHYLLLDEFYRTALILAGRFPIWWLVPAGQESDYDTICDVLRQRRFIKEDETLDLGSVANIPAGEFVGAGLWHLYKGLKAPYKSLLKLLLAEVYAHQHQDLQPLALDYKQAIYSNELDPNRLDPYILLYQRLEDYLKARNQPARLELVRQAFYFKAGIALSKTGKPTWQRDVMTQLVEDWHWDRQTLVRLDQRRHWKVPEVQPEYQRLVEQLIYSYRFLFDWSAQQPQETRLVSQRDMTLLGRRLYAAFERRAGKLSYINPGISNDMHEAHLTLGYQDQQWSIWAGHQHQNDLNYVYPIFSHQPLVALLSWCYLNKVIDTSSNLTLYPGESSLTQLELGKLIYTLQQLKPKQGGESVQDQAFLVPAVTQQLLLVINPGVDPLAQISQRDRQLLSERSDSLAYSGLLQENLVAQIEWLEINSWQEWSTRAYYGKQALLQCLQDYLCLALQHAQPLSVQVVCHCPSRARAISERVKELLHDVTHAFTGAYGKSCRYIMAVAEHYFLLQLQDEKVEVICLENRAKLIDSLADTQPEFSPLVIDRHALIGHDLTLIAPINKPGSIQICYRTDSQKQLWLYVFDEQGSLFYQRYQHHKPTNLLQQLQRFLLAIQLRQSAIGHVPERPELYEIIRGQNSKPAKLQRQNLEGVIEDTPCYQVQVLVNDARGHDLTIYCNHQPYHSAASAQDVFKQVASAIISQREGSGKYPCYITDLDFATVPGSQPRALQTVQYLCFKKKLEAKLNQALQLAG